jgi:kumamolisin
VKVRRLRLLGVAAAPLTIGLAAMPAMAAATPSVAAPRIALYGDTVSALSHATRTGELAAGSRVSVAIGLAPRDPGALRAFIGQVSDRHSAQYGHYLTPARFAARFGPTAGTLDQVRAYLRSAGLSVGAVGGGHLVVDASGTAGQVEKAFGTSLATYRDTRTGHAFYANATAPTVPAAIASYVTGVSGLSDYGRMHHESLISHKATPHATSGYTPTQITGAYDVPSSDTGSGVTVGLVEFSTYAQSDVSTYDSQYSISTGTPTTVNVDGGTTDTSGQDEVDLDIEAVQAIAPGASIDVYVAPNTSTAEVDMYQQVVTGDLPVVSVSWGQAEASDTNLTSVDNLLQEASAQGQSIFVASGDSGSDDAGNGGTSVDFPASDPYVTGVGGTTLTVNSGNSYGGETAWSGSGGGTSSSFSQPSFQSSVTSDSNRDVPDVSADADPNTGWSIYTSGAWQEFGGTSVAAPTWAAFAAVYDQVAAAGGKSALGYADPTLYTLAEGANHGSAFHDVTSGSNGAYSAGTGYDQVTGWGSFDAANFISAELG